MVDEGGVFLKIKNLVSEILQGKSRALARGITLLESSRIEDWLCVRELLSLLPENSSPTCRLGFSGPPGVGKSTFIESLGLQLTARGKKVAVLAVDPSSEKTGGSILGDKTRMEKLSQSQRAFIRPSPNRGHLGGVTGTLPGAILLCEAAGFQWILVESVGVGQSEVELSQMVDVFTFLASPGAGDELQGIKKGILEFVDFIVVNKADRDQALARISQQQYLAALKITRSGNVMVETCSALTGEGVDQILEYYFECFKNPDIGKRQLFPVRWFESLIHSEFRKRLKFDPRWTSLVERHREEVRCHKQSPVDAVDQLFEALGL